ncbi:MAG TPA: PQQ-dependent sugar dehydrogenase [Chthoniobacterales bacterium]|nr:PQQ-dependent sugar dehydrogenase [Chthoniobacterales bacterium]
MTRLNRIRHVMFPGCRGLVGSIAICFLVGACSLQAAELPAGFTESQYGSTLNPGSPTAMAFSPDGRLFVCLQGGQLRVIDNGTLLATPFVTVTTTQNGERGLLGVTFDPSFASNQFVYVYYTVSGSPAHNRVSRFTANGNVAVPGSETIILELDNLSGATNHNGGAIHFGPDGKLYVAVGENANGANAQSLGNRLGKVLRINSDGTIPPDNPTTFPGISGSPTGVNRAIWAVGLRNPYTFAFQPGTGRMFINDVGQSTWEEINDGIAASNYGWPNCEGDCGNPNFRDPLFQYGHNTGSPTGCAIVGGTFYNPPVTQFPPSYVGKYFFADLCTGFIRTMDPSNNTSSEFATGLSTPVDLQVGPDGGLYYLIRGGGGQVWRIVAAPAQASNISSRSQVATAENVMIGGFIITGNANKRVIVRALGPSLQQLGVPNPLADPRLELCESTGAIIASNDNWRTTQETEIINSQLAPTNDLESAIIATLQPGAYTAIVQGTNGGNGVGVVEVYDLDLAANSKLANISTRSLVQTGDNRLIGGFILGSNAGATTVVVRAIGPSLTQFGIGNALADPILELRDSDGALILANDDWEDDPNQAALIRDSGIPPTNSLESAILISLFPGPYTVIVAGANGGTGIGLVEIYNIP